MKAQGQVCQIKKVENVENGHLIQNGGLPGVFFTMHI